MRYKIGDKVKIIKKFKSSELCYWNKRMDKCIGKTGIVMYEHNVFGRYYTYHVEFPEFPDSTNKTTAYFFKVESFQSRKEKIERLLYVN